MANVEDLKKFLNEHIRYEVVQLRHSLHRWREIDGGGWKLEPQQLDLNAYIESFGTHARNLAQFLTNEGKDTDRKAREYNKGFEHSQKVFDKLKWGAFVFHLGKGRLTRTAAGEKPTLTEAEQIADWVEQNFAEFRDGMDERYRSSWDENAAKPEAIQLGRPRQSATNAIGSTTTATNILGASMTGAPNTPIGANRLPRKG